MWWTALVGCVAALENLQFTETTFQSDGETKFLIKVTGDGLTCGTADEDPILKAQYNLGSIFIPGVSPLAYHKEDGSQTFQYAAPGTSDQNELPEWWQNRDPEKNLYRLINEDDSPLLSGMFIPELELNGQYWVYNDTTETGKRPTYGEARDSSYKADLDVFMKELASKYALGDQAKTDSANGLPVLDSFTSSGDDFGENELGNLTGFKYAPTGAINLRLYSVQNKKVYKQLKNIPMQPDGSVQKNDLSVDQIEGGGREFYDTSIKTMKRFPGMVPVTAPYGVNGVDHLSPGYPFFSYSIKRCPGDNADNACCLVVEGDAKIDESNPEGKESATDMLTRLRPSTLITPDGGPTEYRARWNVISSHTSFSRVVPDIGSYDPDGTKKGQLWHGDFVKKLPENKAQELVMSAFKNTHKHMWPLPNGVASDFVKDSPSDSSDESARVWGNSLTDDVHNLVNKASPKCFWQRQFPGARERIAAMFLEHFYVAFTGEDELHQLRKRQNQIKPDYSTNGNAYQRINEGLGEDVYPKTSGKHNWKITDPKYSKERPFSLQMPFEGTAEGNLEKHVTFPTSSQPLFFSTYLENDKTGDEYAKAESGPYSTNIPFVDNFNGIAGQYENVISGMLKRYSDTPDSPKKSTPLGAKKAPGVHHGCSPRGYTTKVGGKTYTFPDVFTTKRGATQFTACANEMNRVVIWDVDSTFGTIERADDPEQGYRVDRTSDAMAKLMHLHTGTSPVGKKQVNFPNYRPVRSMFDATSWSEETMCFGNDLENEKVTEACARKACGSGRQWCEVTTDGTENIEGRHLKAPWQRLSRTGTSDGTFRNNFWQSVCWIDPFMDGEKLAKAQDFNSASEGNDINLKAPASTFSAGTLSPGSSFEHYTEQAVRRWKDRSSKTNQPDDTWDRSSFAMCSLHTQLNDQFNGEIFPCWGPCQNRHDRADMTEMNPFYYTQDDATPKTFLHFMRYSGDMNNNVDLCDKPPVGYAQHTCADQNNRTFFRTRDFGRRGLMYTDSTKAKEFLEQDTAVPPRGEAWDMRWTWTKAAQSNGNNWKIGSTATPHRFATQRVQGRHDPNTEGDSTDPDHVENYWQWAGPDGVFSKLQTSFAQPVCDGLLFPVPAYATLDSAVIYAWPNKNQPQPSCGQHTNSIDVDTGDGNFGRKSYFCKSNTPPHLSVAPSARGCHMPANPMWGWPGLVVDTQRETCKNYDENTPCDCRHAAWSPPMTIARAYDGDGNKRLFQSPNFGKSPTQENCPTNNAAQSPAENPDYDDVKGIWPANTFEILHGMTGHSHVGRIDWDKHPFIFGGVYAGGGIPVTSASNRIRGKYYDNMTHAIEGHNMAPGDTRAGSKKYGTKYTLGPYPLRGKNDGLLECPSSIRNRNFEFHQHIMLHSMLKTHDICINDDPRDVDESGLDAKGFSKTKDTQSWCINPQMYAHDMCVDWRYHTLNYLEADENDRFAKMCFAVLGDGRTLPGDEEETRIGERGQGGESVKVDADTIKKMCHCTEKSFSRNKLFSLHQVSQPETKQPDVMDVCLCRSQARSTRSVVGSFDRFNTLETNPEDPEWLKPTSLESENFPMCSCGTKSPCIINRICSPENLGNRRSVERDFKADFRLSGFATNAGLYTEDPSARPSDGSIRYDPVPLQFIGRDVPYTAFEMNRLRACAGNPASAECTNTRPTPGIVPESQIPGIPSQTYYSIRFLPGTSFDITGESPGKRILNQLFCASSPLLGPTGEPLPGAYPQNDPLFGELWGNHIPVFRSNTFHTHNNNADIQIADSDPEGSGQQSEPGCTLSIHKREGHDLSENSIKAIGFWDTAGIGPDTDLNIVTNDGGTSASLYVEKGWYQTTLDLDQMARIGHCLEYTYLLLLGRQLNVAERTALENACRGRADRTTHSVKLITETTTASSAQALGRCFGVTGIAEDKVYTTTKRNEIVGSQMNATEFIFEDQFCEDFRGIFVLKQESPQPAIFDEMCQNDDSISESQSGSRGAQGLSCTSGIQTLQSSAGTCVKSRNAIPISVAGEKTRITLPNNALVPTKAADENMDVTDVCNQFTGTPYIFRARQAQDGSLETVGYGEQDPPENILQTGGDVYMFTFDAAVAFETGIDTEQVTTITIENADVYICTDTARELIQADQNVDIFFGECGVFTVNLGLYFLTPETATRLIAFSNFEDPSSTEGFDADRGFYCGQEDPDEIRKVDSCGNKRLPREIQVQSHSTIPGVDRAVVELVPRKCRHLHSSPYSRAVSENDLPTLNIDVAGECEDTTFCGDVLQVDSPVIISGEIVGVEFDPGTTPAKVSSSEQSFVDCHKKCHEEPEHCSMIKWVPKLDDPDLPGTCFRYKDYDIRSVSVPTPILQPKVLTDTTEADAGRNSFLVICPLKTPVAQVETPDSTRVNFCPVGFRRIISDYKPGEAPPHPYCTKTLCPDSYFSSQTTGETQALGPSSTCPDPIEMYTSKDHEFDATKVTIIPVGEGQNSIQVSQTDSKKLVAGDRIEVTYTLPAFKGAESVHGDQNILSSVAIDLPQLMPLPEDCVCTNSDDPGFGIDCNAAVQSVSTVDKTNNEHVRRFRVKSTISLVFETTDDDGAPKSQKVELGTHFHGGLSLSEKLHKKFENGISVPSKMNKLAMTVVVEIVGVAVVTIDTLQYTSGVDNGGGNRNPPTSSEFNDQTPIDADYEVLYLPSVPNVESTSFYTESILYRAYLGERAEPQTAHQFYCPVTKVVDDDPLQPPLKFTEEACDDGIGCILTRPQEMFLTICKHVDPVPHNCGGVTVCTASEYEHTAPTETSDRKCLAITTCETSEYEHTAPTASSDRGCARRPECNLDLTYYGSNPDDPAYDICVPKTGCQHVGSSTNANTPDVAVNHVVDSDASTRDVQCVEITTCRTNPEEGEDQEYVSKAHTAVSDRECTTVIESCAANENYETAAPGESNDRVCTPVSVCLEGETEAKDGQPTPSKDRVCVPVGVLEEEEKEKEAAEPLFDAVLGWTLGGVGVGGLVVALLNAGLLW